MVPIKSDGDRITRIDKLVLDRPFISDTMTDYSFPVCVIMYDSYLYYTPITPHPGFFVRIVLWWKLKKRVHF